MGHLHVRAWQAAYRGVMPDEYLDGLEGEQRAGLWAGNIGCPPSGSQLLVIEGDDGNVVGFAAFGRERKNAEPAEVGELYVINLEPDVWRQGLGRQLLRAATLELARIGFRQAILWVVPENDRARRLYESEGWVADRATREEDVLGVTVREVRYRRHLP